MTELMYLQYPETLETISIIKGKGCDARGIYLILDCSPFYPQGGGQPADHGSLTNGEIAYKVYDVRYLDGEVRHYIDINHPDSSIEPGQEVMITVDKNRRMINTKYHTAGHLIAAIAETITPKFTAIKGHQFPGEAYIEFSGIIEDTEDLLKKLTSTLTSHLNSDKRIEVGKLDSEQAKILSEKLLYALPENRSLRVCRIEGFTPIPCGGTHVNSLKEIGAITIQKCKSKKGKTKIYYEVMI